MNIIFPTISSAIKQINNRGIYPDLVRKLANEGHNVYVVFPKESKTKTTYEVHGNIFLLGIPFSRIVKSNIIERLWAMWRISSVFEKAINKHFSDVRFDLILYATPPITFNSLIAKLKSKHSAFCYLMLKDIFPQNAVDLGMMSKKSFPFKYFEKKEKQLYNLSDFIGCMSPANVDYIVKNEGVMLRSKLGICPNAIEIRNTSLSSEEKSEIRRKYNLPTDKQLIVYGGNLGKPQGIGFLLEVLEHFKEDKSKFFVIAGAGTEMNRIQSTIEASSIRNASFFAQMDKQEYELIEASSDVALVLLDKRFTIPNFPSRILSYMENELPILCATDNSTDVGEIIESNGCGLAVTHGDLNSFSKALDSLISSPDKSHAMGKKGRSFLEQNYSVEHAYNAIMNEVLKKQSQ